MLMDFSPFLSSMFHTVLVCSVVGRFHLASRPANKQLDKQLDMCSVYRYVTSPHRLDVTRKWDPFQS